MFQHWNLLEKGFLCRRFRRSEGPSQKNFLQIKVEEDLKFLFAQITLKYSKKRRETAAAHRVFARWARVDHPPLYGIGYRLVTDESHIGRIWVKNGSHVGHRIGYRWLRVVSRMSYMWVNHCNIRSQINHRMGYIWIIYGSHMSHTWVTSGSHMSYT